LNESAAQDVLLIRAIETADAGAPIIDAATRDRAERDAASAAGTPGTRGGAQTFLVQRAALLREALRERAPKAFQPLRAVHWRPWVGVALPLAAFVFGLVVQHISDHRHLSILAFPMLILVLWNLCVYVALLIHGVWQLAPRRASTSAPGPIRSLLVGVSARMADRIPGALGKALAGFALDWSQRAGPLLAARAARVLHFAAAALATGAICGLYLRGIAVEFRSGWESTFLDARAVHGLIHAFLTPAAWLSGEPLPTVEQVAALHWEDASGAGENAGRWIHLYTVTVLAAVIIPRLLLGAWARLRESALATRFPLSLDDPYFRRVLLAWGATIELGLVAATRAGAAALWRVFERTADAQDDADDAGNAGSARVVMRTDRRDTLQLIELSAEQRAALAEMHATQRTGAASAALRGLGGQWSKLFDAPRQRARAESQSLHDALDVVLAVVEVRADPAAPEMRTLFDGIDALHKPAVALLYGAAPEQPERSKHWRDFLRQRAAVRGVLSFDEFARCEFQLEALLRPIANLVHAEKQPGGERFILHWRREVDARLAQAMDLMARQIVAIAADKEPLALSATPLAERIQKSLGIGASSDDEETPRRAAAAEKLAARTDTRIRETTARVLALYGASGPATDSLFEPLRSDYSVIEPTPTAKAAAVGGIVSGALSGLMADLATGGLSLGAGVLVGTVIGAFGGAGVARGRDSLRGIAQPAASWNPAFLDALTRATLWRFLAIVHMRGLRGMDGVDGVDGTDEADGTGAPQEWSRAVADAYEAHRADYQSQWQQASRGGDPDAAQTELASLLRGTALRSVYALYPALQQFHVDDAAPR
jgi:hypothetical protein